MTTLYAFGCPHSGTTYLWRSLQEVTRSHNELVFESAEVIQNPSLAFRRSANVYRITESNPLHPCLSNDGLIGLSMMEVGKDTSNVVLIRILRDPVQVFESFYAKRVKGSPVYMRGVNDDERIFDFIIKERTNVAYQKERYAEFKAEWTSKHKRGWPFRLIEVHYEDLATMNGRKAFCDALDREITGIGSMYRAHLRRTWMKVPIRHGRLSQGITESLLSDELKKEIRERCSSL